MPSSVSNMPLNATHSYAPPKEGEKRSPCPGLNAMANHGFIPRDGRALGFVQLVNAMREVYNLSIPLASLLAFAGLLLCGRWKGFQRVVDLDALAAHNKIEHDASLVHKDATTGDKVAPIGIDQSLVQRLGAYGAPGSGLALSDFARARHDREALLKRPLSGPHEEIACAEPVMTWLIMKDSNGEVPRKSIEQWFGEERLPEGWSRPVKTVGLMQTRGMVKQLKEIMKLPAPPTIVIDRVATQ